MGGLEERVRRLERKFVYEPTVAEYLDASNREQTRALHALARRLEKYGFDGAYLFTEHCFRVLAEDTPEKRGRDRETVEAWYRAQGIVPESEGAKERLLGRLEAYGN